MSFLSGASNVSDTVTGTRATLRWLSCFASLLLAGWVLTAVAAPIVVPNGDFSNPANNGTINTAGTAPIGSGPWSGTSVAVAGLLLPPTLTIGAGAARIDGLLSINVAGILNNSGRFHLDTGAAWIGNRRYTVSVDVDANVLLGAGVLTSGNVGVALATSNTVASRVASSATGAPVTLTLLSGTRYRITLTHETNASVSGNVFIHLFAEPGGVLSANLLSAITFDDVALASQLLTQTPAGLVPGNPGPYTAFPESPVTPEISVTVVDALGDPIPGVNVTFTAPVTGASAVIAPNPVTTDTNGTATATAVANAELGSYSIVASVPGVPSQAFQVRNILPDDITIVTGEPRLLGEVNGLFSCVLLVHVSDAEGLPLPGIVVDFLAPLTGPSAILSNDISSGVSLEAVTDGDGFAWAEARANSIEGSYVVTAGVRHTLLPSFEFNLRNLGHGDPLHAHGFDGPCVRPASFP